MYGTKLFLAGAEVEMLALALFEYDVKWVLFSYYYLLDFAAFGHIHRLMEEHPETEFFLDSGAFTYAEQSKIKTLMPPAEYVQSYFEYLEHHGHKWCRVTEPDIDGIADNNGYEIASVEQVKAWREEMLTRWPHLPVTPCWHGWRGDHEWQEYLRDPRIQHLAIGRAGGDIGQTRRMVMQAHRVGKTVHGFGCTRIKTTLKHVPYNTVDSSVDGDSLVWVRDPRGSAEVLPIRELYQRTGGNTRGWETSSLVSLGDEYGVQWTPLAGVVRHVVRKAFCEVLLEGGRKVRVTGDHSLFVMTPEGELAEKKPGDIRVGECLATVRCPRWGGEGITSLYVPALRRCGRGGRGKRYEVENVPLDEHMLAFVGLWIADGSYGDAGTVQVSAGNDAECLHLIRRIGRRYGGTVRVMPNGVDVKVFSARLVRVLRGLACVGTSATKQLPRWFWRLSREGAGALLRGYFSGDGSGGTQPYATTVSTSLWRQLGEAVPAVIGEYVSVAWSDARRSSFGGDAAPSGRVTICGERGREAFLRWIGFLQAAKVASVPTEATGRADDRIGALPLSTARRRPRRSTGAGLMVAVGCPDGRVRRDTDPSAFHPKVLSHDVIYPRVRSVEWQEETTRDVYDLSVPDGERFLADGVLVHNTSWVMGQKYGTIYIFKEEGAVGTFLTINAQHKADRKRYKSHFKRLGLDPQLIFDDKGADSGPDVVREVRRANVLAWTRLAARMRLLQVWGEEGAVERVRSGEVVLDDVAPRTGGEAEPNKRVLRVDRSGLPDTSPALRPAAEEGRFYPLPRPPENPHTWRPLPRAEGGQAGAEGGGIVPRVDPLPRDGTEAVKEPPKRRPLAMEMFGKAPPKAR